MANHSKMSAAGVLTYSGANNPGWISNIAIKSATTTNTNDSIKITSADGTALSTTNPGWLTLPGVTAGQLTTFEVTADVTILTTAAHWGIDTSGDITGGLLRVLAINDNGTLKFGIAYLGGRHTLLTTDTSATASSVTLPEHVLCNTAVSSASNTCFEIGFVRSDFDDTGGAAENLWTNQTGVGDIVTGRSADGLWQRYNPVVTGFSSDPAYSASNQLFCQIGSSIAMTYSPSGNGTSNATTFTLQAPSKVKSVVYGVTSANTNNSVQEACGYIVTAAASRSLDIARSGNVAWTAALSKGTVLVFTYPVGPAASFIE